MKIRIARPPDVVRLAEIEIACFSPEKYASIITAAQFARFISRRRSTVLVADFDGQVEGYASLMFLRDKGLTWFYSLAVNRDFQGKGVAIALFKESELAAQQNDCPRMILEIRADNKALLWRYTRSGYKTIQHLEGYYPDGCAAIRMAKDL